MSSSPRTPRRARPPSSTRPSPARTPLGPSRSLPLARSRSKTQLNATTKQFFDQHSETYAHLYEHPDEATRREKLELEEKRLEEERRRGREMRERLKGSTENMGLGGGIEGIRGKGKGWRPLSLVAKRSPGGIGLGHARSASATHNPAGIRSVSTPIPAHYTRRDISQTWNDSDKLEVVLERSDSPTPSRRSSRDTPAASSQNHSTYSWATSFSGETAELRTTAQYVRKSLDYAQPYAEDQEEGVEDSSTPDKVKRRRKRIVALAHTVRQLEGVGSREAEDPDFYGVLVKAWNERPGMNPIPDPTNKHVYPPMSNGLSEGPPGLLPPPNLPTYSYPPRSQYSPYPQAYLGDTNTPSTSFSPPEQYLHTPALGFSSSSSSSTPRFPGVNNGLYVSADDAESLLESDMGSEGRRSGSGLRSGRYSYASALHDLGLEENVEMDQGEKGGSGKEGRKGYGKGRWSGAWEGWAGGPSIYGVSRVSGIRQEVKAAQPHAPTQPNDQYRRGLIDPGTPNRPSFHNDHPTPTRSPHSHSAPHNHLTPTSRHLTSTSADVPAESTPKSGWGLGFMSAWWSDRPSSQVQDDAPAGQTNHHQMNTTAQDMTDGDISHGGRGMAGFQSGEEESLRPNQTLTQTRPLSLVTTAIDSPEQSRDLTPSSEIDRSYTLTMDSHDLAGSGTSTPSFGTRIHASAERRWIDAQSARPRLRLNVNTGGTVQQEEVQGAGGNISPSPWRGPMLAPPLPPPETGWSDITINTDIIDHVLGYTSAHHRPETRVEKGVTPSASYTTTSSVTPEDGEKEFPFTKHCLPPTPSRTPSRAGSAGVETPLTTDSSFLSARLGMAAVIQARALREARDQQRVGAKTVEMEMGKNVGERAYSDGSENGSYLSKPLHHLYHHPTLSNPSPSEKKEKMEILLPESTSTSEMHRPTRKGLLERRRIGPLKLDDILNPLVLSSGTHHHPQEHLDKVQQGTELQSSISHKMYLTTSGISPVATTTKTTTTTTTSTATTPSSAQTVFLPPHGTPMEGVTPTENVFPIQAEGIEDYPPGELVRKGEAIQGISSGSRSLPDGEIAPQYPWGRRYHPNRPIIPPSQQYPLNPDLNSNPSYYHSDLPEPGQIGGTAPVRCAQGRHSPSISHNELELGQEGYRDPTPSVMTATAEPQSQSRRNWSPVLFWLGFIMPWCWVFGGWPIGSTDSRSEGTTSKGEQDVEKAKATQPGSLAGKSWLRRWTYHPDPYVRRCRIAAGMGLPLVAVLAVVGVIVLAATR